MTARILERGLSSGRIDDNEEAIRKRLATYHESTMPIIKEFEARGKLREVNSDQTIGVCVFCVRDTGYFFKRPIDSETTPSISIYRPVDRLRVSRIRLP